MDNVNHPHHYTWHPSGVECLQITEAFSFNLGNAIKYIWRSGHKGKELEDLKKARFYIDREIGRLTEGRVVVDILEPEQLEFDFEEGCLGGILCDCGECTACYEEICLDKGAGGCQGEGYI